MIENKRSLKNGSQKKIVIDKTLLIIILAPIVIGAFYYLKENKRDKLQDWKPHE